MKRLVIKTTIITIISIILVASISFGVVALCAPKTMARGLDKIGANKVAVNFYERAYNKSGDIVDLYDLSFATFAVREYSSAEAYFVILNQDEGFDALCQARDEERNSLIPTADVCRGALARSTFEAHGFDSAVDRCVELVKKGGYTAYNPFFCILESYGANLNIAELQQLKTTITAILDGEIENITLTASQTVFAQEDVQEINKLITALGA